MIKQTFSFRLTGNDLKKFRFIINKYSPEGNSLPFSYVIRNIILNEYQRLLKKYPEYNDVIESEELENK
jgi:hypothetical protein